MSLDYIDSRHSNRILSSLNQQRKTNELCDVVINVGEQFFHVHQNVLLSISPKVRSLTSHCDIGASDELSINIDPNYMSTSSVEELLNYFYTGKVSITMENVEELLRGVKLFEIKQLKNYCGEYMQASLNKTNCFRVLKMAESHDLQELAETAYKVIRDQFFSLAVRKDLLATPYNVFSRLIKDEKLHAQNEDHVFLTVLQWTKHMPNRVKHFEKLFSHLHLSNVSNHILLKLSKEEDLIKNNVACINKIMEVVGHKKTDGPRDINVSQRKETLIEVVLVLGGHKIDGHFSNKVYAYLIRDNRWVKVTDMPYNAAAPGAVSLGKYLFVTGGTNKLNPSLKAAWRYDLDKNIWSKMPDLPVGLVFHTMVACRGSIFTVGGSIAAKKYISTIYKFDEEKDRWVTVGNMSVPLDCAEAIPKHNNIYIVTGRCMVNDKISRVGVVDCFDVTGGTVKKCLTFPIEFRHRPLVSIHDGDMIKLQSHKQSLDINMQKCKVVKCPNTIPLLPNNTKLEISNAVCQIGDNVFVCGGTIPVDEINNVFTINQSAFLFKQKSGEWDILAKPIESMDSSACCRAKLTWRIVQTHLKPRIKTSLIKVSDLQ
ncbi:UNVERIFIED_CONTAM: hypothetical protein FKN15_062898 [Acipenser sinensis]